MGRAMDFFIAIDGVQRGPFKREELLAQGLQPHTLVWADGMPSWVEAGQIPALASLFSGSSSHPIPPISHGPSNIPLPDGHKKIAAGICGILFGAFGVHKFILGMTKPGLIMLIVSLLTFGIGGAVMHVIGLVEGIIYLTRTDDEFYRTYILGRRAWF
jgi:TM2 domain-containing membrane protein YozV